jgi:pimeloyl-ACP methyl ester carboxylesterase
MKEINVLNVKVGEHNDEPIYMNTVVVGKTSLPKIVWIHGFGASNALYYKMYKPLKDDYCMMFIDMIGMGSSSRPDNFNKNYIDVLSAIDYFI